MKKIELSYPQFFNGVLSNARAKELEKTAEKTDSKFDIKLDDVRRLISGNPYTADAAGDREGAGDLPLGQNPNH